MIDASRKPGFALTLGLTLGLASCTTTSPHPTKTREEMREYAKKRAEQALNLDEELNKAPRVRLDLDRALFEYFKTVHTGRDPRVLSKLNALDGIIRKKTRRHFHWLVLDAANPKQPGNRGIALAAIGFADEAPRSWEPLAEGKENVTSDQSALNADRQKKQPLKDTSDYADQALEVLVTALNDSDDYIVNQALHGLAVLKSPDTPIHSIARLVEESKTEKGLRQAAAWTLLNIQEHMVPQKRKTIRPVWIRLLSQPIGEVPGPIVVQALRGLGLFRLAQDAKIVEPYIDHPAPLVRCAVAVALGRQKHPESHKRLLELLMPTETNQNVKLGARKALKSLAGGKDRGWDVKKWQQLFDRK